VVPVIGGRSIAAGNAVIEAVRNSGGKPTGDISRILKSDKTIGTVNGNGGSSCGMGA